MRKGVFFWHPCLRATIISKKPAHRRRVRAEFLVRTALQILLLLPALATAQVAEQIEPPHVGRPKDFSGAVGSYTISMDAKPTEVLVEEPITLIVRITGSGPTPPRRLKLSELAKDVETDFYVEDLPKQDRELPEKKTWEFHYRLKPKHLDVRIVPRLRFVYYDPELPEGRRFQPRFTRETIVLTVKPRPVEVPPPVENKVEHPERFYQLGQTSLARPVPALLWWAGVILALLAPPFACVVWYQIWRRLYPDAVEQLKRRRSRAARNALNALEALGVTNDGEKVAAIVTGYLRQRLELAPMEATPPEADWQLSNYGLSQGLRERVVILLRACDAVRFAPQETADKRPLTADATDIVLAVEAELCAA